MNDPILYQRFAMHLNMGRNGHVSSYNIVDAQGRVVGTKAVRTGKGGRIVEQSYRLGDRDFSTPDAFRKAYVEQLRDAEWEAADPSRLKT